MWNGELRVVLTVEESGRAGTGLVADGFTFHWRDPRRGTLSTLVP